MGTFFAAIALFSRPSAATPAFHFFAKRTRTPYRIDRSFVRKNRYVGLAAALFVCATAPSLLVRDDGRYTDMDPALHAWFDNLTSGKGLCCSFADGFSIADVDWDITCEQGRTPVDGLTPRKQNEGCRYRVRLDDEWIDVPEAAVVTEPNRFGPAVVWPYRDIGGLTQIRCFLPGAGA